MQQAGWTPSSPDLVTKGAISRSPNPSANLTESPLTAPLLTSRLFRSPLEARAAASARVHCKGGLNLYPCSFSWLIDRGGNERSPPHFSSLFPPSQLATRRVMHNRIGPCFCLSHTSRGNGAAQSCVRALSSRVAATLCSEYLHSRSSIHNWTPVGR